MVVVVDMHPSPNPASSGPVFAPAIQVPLNPPVVSALLQPQLSWHLSEHGIARHAASTSSAVVAMGSLTVVVLSVVLEEDILVVKVEQTPTLASAGLVLAPRMQVPAGPRETSTLLQPHSFWQSRPHMIFLHLASATSGAGVGNGV
jgi:hypothetical protein